MIHMHPRVVGIATTFLVVLTFGVVVVVPRSSQPDALQPSDTYRPRTEQEVAGRDLYVRYGCQYCHTQYVRRGDWGLGAERIAQAGDYFSEYAPQLGSNRNGPDLSQEGGEHTDDWHRAHFRNPRWTRPESFMPPYPYWTDEERDAMVAYLQSLGGTLADGRVARQARWHAPAAAAYESGADANIRWLHGQVPKGWLEVPTPYPITEASFARGAVTYQRHCLGCHGPVGDGQGPAVRDVYPPPLNFTTLRRIGLEGGATGGMLYYQIMNGITGTAMPYFKRELESEKIWDVGSYVARQFIGLVDANTAPRGIDAAYEPVEPEGR